MPLLSYASYAPTNLVSLAADPAPSNSRVGDMYLNSESGRVRVYGLISELSFGAGAFGSGPFGDVHEDSFGFSGFGSADFGNTLVAPTEYGWRDLVGGTAPTLWDDIAKPVVVAAGDTTQEALSALGIYLLGPNESDEALPIGSIVIRRRAA